MSWDMRVTNKGFSSEVRLLFIIFFILVLIKSVVSFLIPYPIYLSDEREYFWTAKNFIRTGKFLFEGKLSHHYPPLYSIIISLPTLLDTRISVPLIRILNSFLSSTIIFPVWLISREFLNRKKALRVSMLSAFVPESFAYSFTLMSENVYYPLFIFSIYFMLKSLTQNEKKWQVLCGMFIGFSILARLIGLLLLPVIPTIIILDTLTQSRIKLKNKVRIILRNLVEKHVLFLSSFLLVLPWFLRNAYYFGLSIHGVTGYSDFERYPIYICMDTLIKYIHFTGIHIAYIIVGTGILFFSMTFYILMRYKRCRSKKLRMLFLISLVVFVFSVMLGGYWSFTCSIPGEKVMGRYVAQVLPLFLITGSIGLELYEREKAKILLVPLLITSFFLLFLPINKKIFGFDTLSTHFLFIPEYVNRSGILPFRVPNVIVTLLLVLLPISFYQFRGLLQWKYIFPVFLIFFIVSSMITIITLHVASYDAREYMEFALWMRSAIPEGAVILMDKRAEDPEDALFWMVEATKFWTDFKVVVSDANLYHDGVDYIISTRHLPFQVIRKVEAEEGMFEPKKEIIYLYKVS